MTATDRATYAPQRINATLYDLDSTLADVRGWYLDAIVNGERADRFTDRDAALLFFADAIETASDEVERLCEFAARGERVEA